MSISHEENLLLKERVDLLIQENDAFKKKISSLQELLARDICIFFQITNSIKQTKKRFCYENVRECYGDLVYFYGCHGPIQDAEDYKECYKDIFEKKYTINEDDDNQEHNNQDDDNQEHNNQDDDNQDDDNQDDDNQDDNNQDDNNQDDNNQDNKNSIANTFHSIFHLISKNIIKNTDMNTDLHP